jgi:NADPH2:quinone reductase
MAVRRAGGPDVLELVDVPEPTPGPGQALVEVHAAGVNFMDIGVRQGLFWTEMPYPKVLGVEGAGRVRAVGEAWTRSARANASRGSMPPEAMPST